MYIILIEFCDVAVIMASFMESRGLGYKHRGRKVFYPHPLVTRLLRNLFFWTGMSCGFSISLKGDRIRSVGLRFYWQHVTGSYGLLRGFGGFDRSALRR